MSAGDAFWGSVGITLSERNGDSYFISSVDVTRMKIGVGLP